MNLHVHVHAVVSDGVFGLSGDGRLSFYPMPEPDASAVHELTQRVRRMAEGIDEDRGWHAA